MSENNQNAIAVLGAGSFGTALAILLAKNGNLTRLWGRDPEQIELMAQSQLNTKYLPDIKFPNHLIVTNDMAQALKGVSDILVVTPSYAFSETLNQIKQITQPTHSNIRIAWACKGLEPDTGEFLQQRVIDVFGSDCAKAVLSGPTFAKELALGLPTAITLASDNAEFAESMSERLANKTFRVYTSCDLKGVQFGGAIKNIIAIGAGIADGLGFGANARTALITRGLAEMTRLGTHMGGKRETFTGMAGLGDLVLTCTDNQSRNRRFGLALGQGACIEQAAAQIGQVVEGVRNAQEIYNLAKKHEIEMPICNTIYKILYQNLPPKAAAADLLSRDLKVEGD